MLFGALVDLECVNQIFECVTIQFYFDKQSFNFTGSAAVVDQSEQKKPNSDKQNHINTCTDDELVVAAFLAPF